MKSPRVDLEFIPNKSIQFMINFIRVASCGNSHNINAFSVCYNFNVQLQQQQQLYTQGYLTPAFQVATTGPFGAPAAVATSQQGIQGVFTTSTPTYALNVGDPQFAAAFQANPAAAQLAYVTGYHPGSHQQIVHTGPSVVVPIHPQQVC